MDVHLRPGAAPVKFEVVANNAIGAGPPSGFSDLGDAAMIG